MMFLLSVIFLGLLSQGKAQSNNQTCAHEAKKPATCLTLGNKNPLDNELHREEFKKSAIFLFKRDDDFTFPPGGASSNWFNLTQVNVTNLMPKGEEGLVTLTEGGVGHQNLTLHLESQRGDGYHFLVVIRGMDRDFNH